MDAFKVARTAFGSRDRYRSHGALKCALFTRSKSIQPVLAARSEPKHMAPAEQMDRTSKALSAVGRKLVFSDDCISLDRQCGKREDLRGTVDKW